MPVTQRDWFTERDGMKKYKMILSGKCGQFDDMGHWHKCKECGGRCGGVEFYVKNSNSDFDFEKNVADAAKKACNESREALAWHKHTGWHSGGNVSFGECIYDVTFID